MKNLSRKLLIILFALMSVLPLAAQDDVFPVTIEHKFGSTTITQAPQRVITLGFTEQDPVLALGIQPIAIRYWYGDENNAIFPWAVDEAAGTEPIVLNMPYGTLNYEAILALQPDLISAVDSGITEEEYANLSQIAPTLAQYADYVDFGMPWQETTKLIGKAVGKADTAEAIVAEVEARVDEIHAQYPDFTGKTIAVAYNSGGSYGYYTGQDGRGRFFTDMGFVVPEELDEVAGDSFYATVSAERLELLDQDLLVFLALQFNENGSEAARAEIESDPLLSQLQVVKDAHVLYVSDEYDDALQFSTVLSLSYLYDNLVPEIAETLGIASSATASMDCEEGFHAIVHAMGETCVSVAPERVVVLDTGELDNALALGATLVGAPVTEALQYQEYLSDQLGGIGDTGAISEPNLEAILALDPDLILGSKQRYEAIYEQLAQIAPTILTESLRVPWQDNFLLHAQALGTSDTAQELLADYSAHVAEVQEILGDALDSTTISIIRFRPGQVRLYLKSSYIGYILQDVGLARPASQDVDEFSSEISLEQVQDVDADYIFITGYTPDDSDLDTFLESPLWQTLGAVQSGQAIDVNDDTWIAGLGIQAANLVLDDLASLLGS